MKHSMSSRVFAGLAMAVLLSIPAVSVVAQNSPVVSTTVATGQAAPQLSYDVVNVLKLVQANVGEETIVAYIEKSGHGYNLSAAEIIYLRDQGISDRILTAMLQQEQKVRNAALAQSVAPQTPPVSTTQVPAPTAPVAAAPQYQQTYLPPPVTYVQSAPAPLIVMRDNSPRLADYGIYPRHYNYGCYPNYGYHNYSYRYPAASISVGHYKHHGAISFRSSTYGRHCR